MELVGPVEDVDAVVVVVREHVGLRACVKVRRHQGVAGLDVLAQLRQDALAQQRELRAERLRGLALEQAQQQRQLGHLHGLRVDVDAEEVRAQDPLLLVERQAPVAGRALDQARRPALRVAVRAVGDVGGEVPDEQVVVGAQQERA